MMLNCIVANAFVHGDTIRLKPVPVPKKEYRPQPLLIKSNPLPILWGPIPFSAEYRFVVEITSGRTQSDQVGISYLGTSSIWKIIEKAAKVPSKYQLEVEGWRLQVAHRFYLISRRQYAPFGFYVSPLVSYSTATIGVRYYKQNYLDFAHFNANLLVGVQMGRNSNFTMDMFAGLGYKKNTVLIHVNSHRIIPYDTSDLGEFYNSHLKLILGFNFGWAIY